MRVKFKKLHQDAVIPTKGTAGSAGFDLTAVSQEWNSEYSFWEYKTGLAIKIPEGHVGYIFPRSSISKKDLSLCNSVGVIDSDYRGEIAFRFKEVNNVLDIGLSISEDDVEKFTYNKGERIGQLIIMPIPEVEFIEVDELEETERGEGSYGSTGE